MYCKTRVGKCVCVRESETIKSRLYIIFLLLLLLYNSLVAWFKHFNCITANKENC